MHIKRAMIFIKLLFYTYSHQLSPKLLLWQRYSTFTFSWNILRAKAKTTWQFLLSWLLEHVLFSLLASFTFKCRACLGLYNPLCHILIRIDHCVLWTLLKIYQLYASRTGWKIHILKLTDKVIPVTCSVITQSGFHPQISPIKSALDFTGLIP